MPDGRLVYSDSADIVFQRVVGTESAAAAIMEASFWQ